MTHRNLEEKLNASGGAAKMGRRPSFTSLFSRVPAEYSNWREEQRSWRETAALLDLTHHMTDLTIEGPDAIRLLSDLGVNSFANFRVNTGKQFVCCNSDGYMIGDGILFHLEQNKIALLGLPGAHNWVQFNAQSGRYDVKVVREEPTLGHPTATRKMYRYQVQGPRALDVLNKATGTKVPEIKFFNIGEFSVAGHKVRALRHGMAGAPGYEIFGPWDEGDAVRSAILEAGREFGMKPVGMAAYPTTTLESGWIPAPVPAIYTGNEMKAYREWLPASGFEGNLVLAGSLSTGKIEDYYVTPYEMGYGPFIKFDHEFVGRAALERMGGKSKRHKVTLNWNPDDVLAAMRTLFESGESAQYVHFPWIHYGWTHDKVLSNGTLVGLSRCCGYTYSERALLSLALVDADVPMGSEVILMWGREGYSPIIPIRAIVHPCPYASVVRTSYAQGWRTEAANG